MTIEGIPEEMLAVQVVEFKKPYKIHNIKTPQELKPHDMLIKTAVASLCHTDSMVTDGKFPTNLPCVASHEGTGTVVAVGSAVDNFKKGDRVLTGIVREPCGKCYSCQGPNDWHQYCENAGGLCGVTVDGAFAEYHLADNRISCILPDKLSFVSGAPLACAGITVYRSINIAQVKKGGWLALVGAGGGLGHLGIQMAMARGINVVAVDARDSGIELCKKAGAKHVFDARDGKDSVVKGVQDLTDGLGVEATINLSEHETAAPLSCAITRIHGTVVQVAQPPNVTVPFQEFIFRDIRIIGSLMGGQEVCQEMLDHCAENNISVETNVFHGLKEVPKMVELAHSGKMKGKAVCVVDEEAVKGDDKKV